ncbi:enhancer of mRNA-decapping protein 3 isoform X2 [Callorhinus ursinus]|uniref:Enhancer of mRNA-decapping protein 3 n=1 Tax=Zalophus californianus TaxID=9704 RepID=A0A6J2B9K9_ZALCA|nr:enhancer of mRNA-decapping protein 3 isoform X2 [Zalophus californianus]
MGAQAGFRKAERLLSPRSRKLSNFPGALLCQQPALWFPRRRAGSDITTVAWRRGALPAAAVGVGVEEPLSLWVFSCFGVDVARCAEAAAARRRGGSSSSRHPNQATPKKSGLKNGQMKNKDDECFGDDIEEIPDTDFDFEGNLALFDKAAVFEEIDTYERRSGTRSRGVPNERPTRYRHDENILESEPIVYRRITVPHGVSKEFCTDSGLVVPSVSYELHKKLLSVAEKHGLTLERRLEMTGVCASQMALTLLGGPNRLNPKNVHQRPTVALLCGPHVKGAQGISCGRHLANHDVHVILFLPNFVKMLEPITNELSLFSKTQGQQVSNLKDLPSSPVDLVINCLDCPENAFLRDQPWYKAAVAWANRNRAPVLSIDPPVHEGEQGIDAKWSLALGLPLPLGERAGRIYLCDIGLPQQVFQEVGISYHSPFGCKFVIPLHSA